jgi:hypothetical protein
MEREGGGSGGFCSSAVSRALAAAPVMIRYLEDKAKR